MQKFIINSDTENFSVEVDMSAIYLGFDGDFRVLRKNGNSDIMSGQITVIII